jgi:membrane-associated phospholipid phosphatase
MTTLRICVSWLVTAVLVLAPATTGFAAPPLDAGAGNWRMMVLTGPTQFAIPLPAQTTSADYAAELTAIKSAQAAMTPQQRAGVEYWGKGGVLRWNEILLGMVSRYNLPPAPLANNTYPVPDANNPFADPNFPFANPPYAARAYAYVAVAQADALKSAWYYKFLYNRPAPARVDSGVKALGTVTDLPAYPSEDAVLSGVTAELLKLLFPASVEEITLRAAEQRQAALLAGKATASDLAAGVALGQAVAAVFVARAAADGMRTAGGSPALWQALADGATARGEVPWKSQETPARPPMLPAFGAVRAWAMTPEDIVRERPAPPPSTSSQLMERETAEVRRYVDRGSRRELEIANFWSDGPGTPTPPGHWNLIAAPFVRQADMSEVRAARAFALLNMALHDAAVACWEAKFFYFNPRPTQMDPELKSLLGMPNFPSYTSGHSTFSSAAAEVLSYLFPTGAQQFEAQKEEAAISRLYGGIHYRSDIEIGKAHGKRVGGYTVSFARTDGAQ